MKTKPSFDEEEILWNTGYDFAIGIDEVGRGAFAGPIFAASVVFPRFFKSPFLKFINDSKLLKPKERETLAVEIKKSALFYSIASIGVGVINRKGIGAANKMVFRKVIAQSILKLKGKHFVLADGFHIKYVKGVGLKNQKAIIGGDRKSISIAAASIIAKVERDKLMRDLNRVYPNYGLKRNKGYGTLEHRTAIKLNGLSRIHRIAFCHP